MELDDRALPPTCGPLDVWLAQHASDAGTECKLDLFARFEGTVDLDLLEQANRQALQEPEGLRTAFFEVDGQVFRKAIDHPDVELAFYDLNCSEHRVQEAREISSLIQRVPMPFNGRLFKFGSL
jgi:hypothetical protein